MPNKVRVILITDGDRSAKQVIERVSQELGLRCISASAGNPTPISGEEIVRKLYEVPYDPVLVMFDDRGRKDTGKGEKAMQYVASHPEVEVLGALAVASNAIGVNQCIRVDACIDCQRHIINGAVNKFGRLKVKKKRRIKVICGDTVQVLNKLNIPVIIGIGDIGKMNYADDLRLGAPITKRAIEEILRRSGLLNGRKK